MSFHKPRSGRSGAAQSGVKLGPVKKTLSANCVTDSLLSTPILHYRNSPCICHHKYIILRSVPKPRFKLCSTSTQLSLPHIFHTTQNQQLAITSCTTQITLSPTKNHPSTPPPTTTTTMSEFLQIAQVLADLSSLQNTVRPHPQPPPRPSLTRATTSPSALPSLSISHTPPQEPTAAQNLLAANKSLSPGKLRRKSKEALLPEPARFDKFGRRILRAPAPLSRANSSFSTAASSVPGSAAGSGAVTPVGGGALGDEVCLPCFIAQEHLDLFEGRKGKRNKNKNKG